jgi:hypothetical protein
LKAFITISVIVILALVVFSPNEERDKVNLDEESTATSQNKILKKSKHGKLSFYLPSLALYTECYENPVVKKRVEEIRSQSNEILAIYLHIFDKKEWIENADHTRRTDFYKLYTPIEMTNRKLSDDQFERLILDAKQILNFDEQLMEKLEKMPVIWDAWLNISEPVVVEDYQDNNTYTYISIMSMEKEGEKYSSVVATSYVNVNGDLIFASYYCPFYDEKSIYEAKQNINLCTHKLLKQNDALY